MLMEMCTKETGKKGKLMGLGYMFTTLMDQCMKASGLMIYRKEKAKKFGLMELSMRETFI